MVPAVGQRLSIAIAIAIDVGLAGATKRESA